MPYTAAAGESLSCPAFLLLPSGEVSNPTQAVNSENTNHVRTRSKYNAIKKKMQINICTCVTKFHVLACITFANYGNNSSAVAVLTQPTIAYDNPKSLKSMESKAAYRKPI